MSKTFRSWDVDQSWLLPPSVHEFVPSGHLAHFVRDTVREALDLSAVLQVYDEERGQPPYHPGMLVALLLYGYCRGVYSSRQLARACEERVDFMAVTGLNRPDFRTISDFRKRPSGGVIGAVCAGSAPVPARCTGETRPCGSGRHQATGQRQPAQGDELPADGNR
jgi:transposase